jgi:hypothetical protein
VAGRLALIERAPQIGLEIRVSACVGADRAVKIHAQRRVAKQPCVQ